MTLLLPHAPSDAAPPYSLASHQDRLRLLDARLAAAREAKASLPTAYTGARTQRRNATPWLNFETRKVGGIRFVKLGRLGFSFWVSRSVPKTFQWEGDNRS